MTDKVTLAKVGSLIDATTAANTINSNSAAIVAAINNTLSLDGTAPNQMQSNLDMNSNRILNLPIPISNFEPLRVIDAQTLNGGGTITVSPLPTGGTISQALQKNSSTNFDVSWKPIPGGSNAQIQYNNNGIMGGYTPPQVANLVQPFLTSSTSFLTALNFGATGNGTTNDGVALNALFAAASSLGAIAYIPGGLTYDVGNSTLTVPDNVNVICGPNATIRRSVDQAGPTPYGTYTTAMIVMGNNCTWEGGILANTAVLATSTTSVTIPSTLPVPPLFTFQIQPNLVMTPNFTFLRVWSASAPQNKFEGTVNSYDPATGILVLNGTFATGSGAHSDWKITYGSVYQCPMVLHGVSNTIIRHTTTTGNWYVGMLMDGQNPSSGGPLTTSFCKFQDCQALGIQNRGFYMYGRCTYCILDNCHADGLNGITDYCFNFNPANAGGSANAITLCNISNCTATGSNGQGFGMGENFNLNSFHDCYAFNINGPSGTGFACEYANGFSPQYNKFKGCVAESCIAQGYIFVANIFGECDNCLALACGSGFSLSPNTSPVVQMQFFSLNNCQAISNTNAGIVVAGNASEIDIMNVKAIANANGIQINSGVTNTYVTGRSVSNTFNMVNNGTNTNQGSLITV